MRHIPAMIVMMACVFVWTGPITAQEEKEAPPVKTELRTYDINDLVIFTPNFDVGPTVISEVSKAEAESKGEGTDMDKPIFVCGTDPGYSDVPRADRITAIEDLIKNLVSRDEWVPVGLRNSIEELNGVLYINATVDDHAQINKLLEMIRADANRMVAVQWVAIEVTTAQLHDIKERFAGGGLSVPTANANALLNELETGKLKYMPVASARLQCMNRQRVWTMPQELRIKQRNERDKPVGEFGRASSFDFESVIAGNGTDIKCTTRVAIATAPGESDKADATDTRVCWFQSTVIVPDGGGVLMTASNGKTAQAGREIVVFMQVAVVKPVRAGADAPR